MSRANVPTSPTDRETIRARIDALPRVSLAHLPTPLDHCPRLSDALGGPQIYIKRDDLTGLAFGGNKTRHLEFVFAELLKKDVDTIVAGAYSQSNWCRQITAAARKFGLAVELVLMHGVKGPEPQGNLLLDRLMGANVTIIDESDMQKIQPHLDRKAEEVRAAGGKPYMIEPFRLEEQVRAAVSYIGAAVELDEQLEAADVDPDWVYICGANMTPAGLIAGLSLRGRRARVVNVSPIVWDEDRADDIMRIAHAAADRLGLDLPLARDDFVVEDGYIGAGYGIASPEGNAAVRLVAETEGIFLDPVYTGKAMAALIGHRHEGRIRPDETTVFIHTGGLPALFSYADDVLGQ